MSQHCAAEILTYSLKKVGNEMMIQFRVTHIWQVLHKWADHCFLPLQVDLIGPFFSTLGRSRSLQCSCSSSQSGEHSKSTRSSSWLNGGISNVPGSNSSCSPWVHAQWHNQYELLMYFYQKWLGQAYQLIKQIHRENKEPVISDEWPRGNICIVSASGQIECT